MAGQAPSRRQLLYALACAAVASRSVGFCQWSYAFAETGGQHAHHATGKPAPKAVYKPNFFSPAEYRAIVELAELILPGNSASNIGSSSTGSSQHVASSSQTKGKAVDAGATDAGTAEFIDFMVSTDTTLQPLFQEGLRWLDTAAGQPFLMLSRAERVALLERVAYRKNFRQEDKPGQEFFIVMRRYTVMGFYTSRIGLESLDFPGLRFYATSPSVPQDGSLKRLGV